MFDAFLGRNAAELAFRCVTLVARPAPAPREDGSPESAHEQRASVQPGCGPYRDQPREEFDDGRGGGAHANVLEEPETRVRTLGSRELTVLRGGTIRRRPGHGPAKSEVRLAC